MRPRTFIILGLLFLALILELSVGRFFVSGSASLALVPAILFFGASYLPVGGVFIMGIIVGLVYDSLSSFSFGMYAIAFILGAILTWGIMRYLNERKVYAHAVSAMLGLLFFTGIVRIAFFVMEEGNISYLWREAFLGLILIGLFSFIMSVCGGAKKIT